MSFRDVLMHLVSILRTLSGFDILRHLLKEGSGAFLYTNHSFVTTPGRANNYYLKMSCTHLSLALTVPCNNYFSCCTVIGTIDKSNHTVKFIVAGFNIESKPNSKYSAPCRFSSACCTCVWFFMLNLITNWCRATRFIFPNEPHFLQFCCPLLSIWARADPIIFTTKDFKIRHQSSI